MSKIFIFIIGIYRKFISPLSPGKCRFTPTCSAYAIEALHRYGFIKGGFLSVRRILKCNPFGPYGYDPVPEPEELKDLHKCRKNTKGDK